MATPRSPASLVTANRAAIVATLPPHMAAYGEQLVEHVSAALAHGAIAPLTMPLHTAAEAPARHGIDGARELVDTLHRVRAAIRGVLQDAKVWTIDLEDVIGDVLAFEALGIASVYGSAEREQAQRRILSDEARLQEVTAQLRSIADSVPIHLLLLDRDERILFANAAAAATWKQRPEELIVQSIPEVIGEAQHAVLRPHTERVLAGESVAYESDFDAPDGTQHFLNTYSPYRDVTGAVVGFVATGADITDRKRVEQRLQSTVETLQEERELRERFVAALSHDLRTPLSAAKMGAELLARDSGDAVRIQRLSTRIIDNIDRADQMVRDLLDVHLLRAQGTLPIAREHCNLVTVARMTLDDLGSIHGARFVLRSAPRVEGMWDEGAVRRILENLCSNAVKYGKPQRPILVTVEDTDAGAVLEVCNEGDPIPDTERARLFDAFRRTDGARASGVQGWGMGLALVKGLAEAHGGSVEVTSADGHTTFRVVLMRAQSGY